MKFKKIIIIFCVMLVIILLGGFTYFHLIKKDNETNIQNNKVNPGEELVYDAEYMIEEFKDKSYVSQTMEKEYSLKDINLPYINLNSDDAKKANENISNLFVEMAEIFKQELNGAQTWYNTAGYNVYQTSDFLSVVIKTEYGGTSEPNIKYFTYNFDLTTFKAVTFKDYLKYINIDNANVERQVNNMIRNYDVIKNMEESLEKSELINISLDTYQKLMEYDSVNYFIEDGKLKIVLNIQVPFARGEIAEVFEIKLEETFGEYKTSEWEGMIKEFYQNTGDYVPDKIHCYYIEQGDFVADIYTDGNVTDSYIFDSKTFIAVNNYGTAIDFIKGERTDSKVMFYENECLAIAYVLDEDLERFKEKYLYITDTLEEYDYRSIYTKGTTEGNRFIIIPKSEEVLVSVYDCFLNSDGELELDNTLLSKHTGIFSILDDYVEVVPHLCIKFEYNGFEEEFYIQFSGEDGKLYLPGVEEEVKDISLY